jgi:hypothetical protein
MPRLALSLLATFLLAAPAQAEEWLSLCSKCLSPTVISKTGAGTANAVAIARITEAAARGWCENWEPGNRNCVREQMSQPEAAQTFRATADCPAGRITAVDGQTYRRDGSWPRNSMGEGRARFRNAAGRIVGADNASGGLGIAQQWEVLCPQPAAARPTAKPATPPPAAAPALYKVGQTVEAKYGSAWIRGRVTRIIPVTTSRGRETHYEVVLDNRQRGILPPDWVRPLPPG